MPRFQIHIFGGYENEIKSLKTSKTTPIDTLPVNIFKVKTDLPYIPYNYCWGH